VLAQALDLDPADLDGAHPMETIRIVGELLNLTVNGLYQLLEMRAQLKNELRIEDRTMIASRENNPLKHSDSARDALRYLVDVRQHGNKLFLQPSKAVGDAVADVCAHEMAVMAGTRAALLAALKQFAPDTVEKRIKKSGALDSVMPALHKAKLWESFLTMYGELEKEAEDHFDRLLNQEFARAYAEQGKKLRRRK
jgi:type VI secretion system FHA domain protein